MSKGMRTTKHERTPVKKRTQVTHPTNECIVCARKSNETSLSFVPRSYLKHHNISQAGDSQVLSCHKCAYYTFYATLLPSLKS